MRAFHFTIFFPFPASCDPSETSNLSASSHDNVDMSPAFFRCTPSRSSLVWIAEEDVALATTPIPTATTIPVSRRTRAARKHHVVFLVVLEDARVEMGCFMIKQRPVKSTKVYVSVTGCHRDRISVPSSTFCSFFSRANVSQCERRQDCKHAGRRR